MPKLTINQVVAANIIDSLLRWDVSSKSDPEAKYWADQILSRHITEHASYIETNDRECLILVKSYVEQLYEIFKKAKEDWETDGKWSEEFLENCKYE